MKHTLPWCGIALLFAGIQACSSDSMAPLGRGAGSGNGGGGAVDPNRDGGGGGGGSSGAGLFGTVYFTETPQALDAGGVNKTSVVAEFFSGVAAADAGAIVPAGCTRTDAVQDRTTCTRTVCDQEPTSEPRGTPVSAGTLQFSGIAAFQDLSPTGAVYPAMESTDVPFWQGGGGLGVETRGDQFPAFSATLSAPTAMNLSAPVAQPDGRRALSRSAGFAFRTGASVGTLRLTLKFVTDGRPTLFECATPGGVELQIPAELVADLPDDATPQSGLLWGEEVVEETVDNQTEDVGRVVVAARRVVGDEAGAPLVWSAFVVQP